MSNKLTPGTHVNGHYRIDERIGSGGFSIVYRAYDIRTNSMVAVKIFAPERGLEQEDINQFKREYDLTNSLSHPYLLRATDYFVHDESPCLVFTYMARGSLYQKIRSGGLLSETEIAKIIVQIAGGLQYMHAKRPVAILHNDIKPDNLLINYSGDYVLTDFGISMEMRNTLMRASNAKGHTLNYTTPERILMKPYSSASDIFSFGVVLYECASGIFQGSVPLGQLFASQSLADPELLTPEHSSRLNQLIRACMAPSATDRPSAAALERYGLHYQEEGYWPEIVEFARLRSASPAQENDRSAPAGPPVVVPDKRDTPGRRTIAKGEQPPVVQLDSSTGLGVLNPSKPGQNHVEGRKRNKTIWAAAAAVVLLLCSYFVYGQIQTNRYLGLVEQGERAHENRDWTGANVLFSSALTMFPEREEAINCVNRLMQDVALLAHPQLLVVDSLMDANELAGANRHLDSLERTFAELLPRDSIEYRRTALKRLPLVLRADGLARNKKYAEAVAVYDEAINLGGGEEIQTKRDQADRKDKEVRLRVFNNQLVQAVRENDAAKLRDALNKGADARTHYQKAPILFTAALKGNLAMVKILVSAGASCSDRSGYLTVDEATLGSPAVIAAALGHTDILRYFIGECGVSVNQQEFDPSTERNNGWSPLGAAAAKGKTAAVRYLIGRGADVNLAQGKNNYRPLHESAYYGHDGVVRLLLEKGAEVNGRDGQDWTPLHMAALGNQKTTTETLLSKGALCNLKTNEGKFAYNLARSSAVKQALANCTPRTATAFRFTDSFNSGERRRFSLLDDENKKTTYTGGSYVLEGLSTEYWYITSDKFATDVTKDFTWKARLNLEELETGNDLAMGLIIAGNSAGDNYRFYINKNKQWVLALFKDKTWTTLKRGQTTNISTLFNAVDLEVRWSDNQLKCYVNSLLVHSEAISSHYGPYFGFLFGDKVRINVESCSYSGQAG